MKIPPPPPRDPRARTYPANVMAFARRLKEGGWTVPAMIDLLEREFGVRPHRSTVLKWVNEDYAEKQRRFKRESDARRRGSISRPAATFTDRELLRLRLEDDLTYGAISRVARRFYGVELTEDQVRHRLSRLGAPKNPNKARASMGNTAARKKAAA